jgi:hypothetical protein
MARYRKKPVEVEAILWTGDNIAEVKEFVQQYVSEVGGNIYIHTLEGNMQAVPGSYIIRGVQGEYYPCDGEIFHMTYEEIPNGDAHIREILGED